MKETIDKYALILMGHPMKETLDKYVVEVTNYGSVFRMRNDMPYCTTLPAIEFGFYNGHRSDGIEWWVEGERVTEEQFNKVYPKEPEKESDE